MLRFMFGIIAGAMLMGSAVYAKDWYQDWQHDQRHQQQLFEQQQHNFLLEEHLREQPAVRGFSGLDPC